MSDQYKVIITYYSLEYLEVGRELEQFVYCHETICDAVIDLDEKITVGIQGKTKPLGAGARFIIQTPDGRNLPLNEAYFEAFGELPKEKSTGEFYYPKLAKIQAKRLTIMYKEKRYCHRG